MIRARIGSFFVRLERLSGYAAEMAFFLALAFAPFVMIAVTLAGRWLPLDLSRALEEVLRGVLPAEAHVDPAEVFAWARSSANAGWLTASFGLALLTVLRFMFTTIAALSFIAGDGRQRSSRLWRHVTASVALLATWVVALLVTASLIFIAPTIENALLQLPDLADLSLSAFAAVRAVTVAVALFATILLTYRLGLRDAASGPRAAAAAGLATLVWLGVGEFFSRLAPALWRGTQLSGTLGSVVLLLAWAYAYAWALLAAALLVARPRPG